VEFIHGSMKAVEDGHILVSRQGSGEIISGSAEDKVTYDYLLLACGRFVAIGSIGQMQSYLTSMK
jgi:hypothetical protein